MEYQKRYKEKVAIRPNVTCKTCNIACFIRTLTFSPESIIFFSLFEIQNSLYIHACSYFLSSYSGASFTLPRKTLGLAQTARSLKYSNDHFRSSTLANTLQIEITVDFFFNASSRCGQSTSG